MGRQRIDNLLGKLNDDDRRDLCCILIKAGYAVKIGKEKRDSKTKAMYYVEFWQED